MHRLVIELPIRQFGIDDLNRTLDNVKSYVVLHRLKQDQSGYVAISRIELKNPKRNLHDLAGETGITEIKPIYRESSAVHIALVSFKPIGWIAEAFRFPNVYPIGPLEIRDEKVKASFVGKSSHIREFLEKMEKAGLSYRILSFTDAKFSPESPISKLTERQRTILLSAYNLGYYAIPRRFDSDQIAKKLNLSRSTVAEHLRKAEQRLVTEAISQ